MPYMGNLQVGPNQSGEVGQTKLPTTILLKGQQYEMMLGSCRLSRGTFAKDSEQSREVGRSPPPYTHTSIPTPAQKII